MKSINKKVVTPIVSSALILLISISVVFGGLFFVVKADNPTKIASGTSGTVTYLYDESGKRIMKEAIRDPKGSSGSGENGKKTYYVNDLYEEDSDGTVRKYVYANGVKVATIGSSIGSSTGSSTVFNHQDHLGGSNVSTDSSGKVVEVNDYYPYGSSRIEEKTGNYKNNKLYTGKELDKNTGLYYYGARYYDPLIGRFTSVDPWFGDLTNPQSLNKYSYVTNNPMRYVDPTGMYGDDVHYTLTYYLALKSGLDTTTATEIAFFNDRIDTDPNTAPRGSELTISGIKTTVKNVLSGITEKYHFQSRGASAQSVLESIQDKDARSLGSALHTYQDSFSHQNLNGLTHAALTKAEEWLGLSTDPDNPVNDVKKAMEMAKSSFMFMREFQKGTLDLTKEDEIKKYNSESSTIWNGISTDVEQYLSSEIRKSTDLDKEENNN